MENFKIDFGNIIEVKDTISHKEANEFLAKKDWMLLLITEISGHIRYVLGKYKSRG